MRTAVRPTLAPMSETTTEVPVSTGIDPSKIGQLANQAYGEKLWNCAPLLYQCLEPLACTIPALRPDRLQLDPDDATEDGEE